MSSNKLQPWRAAWPPVNSQATEASATGTAVTQTACADNAIEYGIAKGDIVVVDGTAANVKPSLRVQQSQQQQPDVKTQPWKASWLAGADAAAAAADEAQDGIEYGVTKGATVVVDGTAANVKPSNKRTVRVVRA